MNSALQGLQELDRLVSIRVRIQRWLDTHHNLNQDVLMNYFNMAEYFNWDWNNGYQYFISPLYGPTACLIAVYRSQQRGRATYSPELYDQCMDEVAEVIYKLE